MDGATARGKKLLKPIGIVLGIIALIFLFNQITNHVFVSQRNITMLFKQSSVLMILASSLMMLLISKNIDLSGGAGVYLTGTVVATLVVNHGWNIYLAIAAGIALGLCMGMLNGFFIGYVGLPAFIVTLAASQVFRGIGYVMTNAATVGPMPKEYNAISEAYVSPTMSVVLLWVLFGIFALVSYRHFRRIGVWAGGKERLLRNLCLAAVLCAAGSWVFGGYRGIPMAVIMAGAIAFMMYIVSTKTVYGRHIFLIGGNMEAARLAGVRTEKRIFQAYIIEGLMYGIGGVVLAARLGGAAATGGTGLELDAVAAACIGGTSMSGGIGSILGVGIGVILLTMIDNVMSLMNVSSYLQMVAKGVILLTAVCLDLYMNKAKFKFRLITKTKK